MKPIILFFLAAVTLTFQSCGGSEETTNGATDSTAVAVVEPNADGLYEGGDIGDYLLYGWTKIDAEGEIASVSDLSAKVAGGENFDGKVQVEIAEVCQKAGCWIVFNDSNGTPIRVFFREHFTIPIETSAGTNAILYGTTLADTISIDMQKHLLDDAKDAGEEVTQAEYDAITADKIETTFDCEAILVAKAK